MPVQKGSVGAEVSGDSCFQHSWKYTKSVLGNLLLPIKRPHIFPIEEFAFADEEEPAPASHVSLPSLNLASNLRISHLGYPRNKFDQENEENIIDSLDVLGDEEVYVDEFFGDLNDLVVLFQTRSLKSLQTFESMSMSESKGYPAVRSGTPVVHPNLCGFGRCLFKQGGL
eukprot:gene35208-45597_t